MLALKTVRSYKKLMAQINKEIEKELDILPIDCEKVVQKFYSFIVDTKCELIIVKHNGAYLYDLTIRNYETEENIFKAVFKFNIYTGNINIVAVIEQFKI